jgi:hypothetical protein
VRKLVGRGLLLPPFWEVTNKLSVHVSIRQGVSCGDQFPVELGDIVAISFPPLCNLFEVGIEPHLPLRWFLFRKGAIAQPARDRCMAYPHLRGDGGLREAKLAQGHHLLVLGQALFSLGLALLGVFWTLFWRHFAKRSGERGRS